MFKKQVIKRLQDHDKLTKTTVFYSQANDTNYNKKIAFVCTFKDAHERGAVVLTL